MNVIFVLTDDQDPQPLPEWIARMLALLQEPERQSQRAIAVTADAGKRLAGLVPHRDVERAAAANP